MAVFHRGGILAPDSGALDRDAHGGGRVVSGGRDLVPQDVREMARKMRDRMAEEGYASLSVSWFDGWLGVSASDGSGASATWSEGPDE